jgi:hypothetical protein
MTLSLPETLHRTATRILTNLQQALNTTKHHSQRFINTIVNITQQVKRQWKKEIDILFKRKKQAKQHSHNNQQQGQGMDNDESIASSNAAKDQQHQDEEEEDQNLTSLPRAFYDDFI